MININSFNKIIEEPMEYTLYLHSDRYILETICGTIALYSIYIELSKEEIIDYKINGKSMINQLAKFIRENVEIQNKRKVCTLQ